MSQEGSVPKASCVGWTLRKKIAFQWRKYNPKADDSMEHLWLYAKKKKKKQTRDYTPPENKVEEEKESR